MPYGNCYNFINYVFNYISIIVFKYFPIKTSFNLFSRLKSLNCIFVRNFHSILCMNVGTTFNNKLLLMYSKWVGTIAKYTAFFIYKFKSYGECKFIYLLRTMFLLHFKAIWFSIITTWKMLISFNIVNNICNIHCQFCIF